jgi:hypothetical protein
LRQVLRQTFDLAQGRIPVCRKFLDKTLMSQNGSGKFFDKTLIAHKGGILFAASSRQRL